MSHGFLATNDYGEVLVSSETRNLHFLLKKTAPDFIDKSSPYYGGIDIIRYRITCATYPVPFFTAPNINSQCAYAVTAIRDLGNNQWDIELIKSGGVNTYPEVYVFCDPRGATQSETHGMIVYKDDGTPSFDSRLNPLVVIGGANVTPVYNPIPAKYGLSPTNCDSLGAASGNAFTPTQVNSTPINLSANKPIFHYASIAQAEREESYYTDKTTCSLFDVFGFCIGTQTKEWWQSTYWCFYRAGIAYRNNNIYSQWIAVDAGCKNENHVTNKFIGINIGGGGSSGGTWPYSNETLNIYTSPVIISDGNLYD